ncbi:hypothetical protein Dcar01_01407 [Deinococcus carri]|uniref:Uncharacterized protein n=1 Tax=Deinococcus carri TaxID=1211323 RepID=A0ABP9W5T3_9DEIO
MNKAPPRFASLPDDDGVWLLTWLGLFDIDSNMPTQRTMRGVVQRIRDSSGKTFREVFQNGYPERREAFDNMRLVQFAVGDLPMLSIGTFFSKGRAYAPRRGLLREQSFKIDFGRQQVFRLGDPPTLLPFESLVARHAEPVVNQSAVTAFTRSTDPYGICVPVAELLRWCYGSSSRMLQAVLSDELARVLDWVDEHALLNGNRLDLVLPPGFPPQDAYTLAWLSQDTQARLQALNIDRSIAVTRGRGRERGDPTSGISHPSALFPYNGVRRVRARGRWVPAPEGSPSRRRFLVHQILDVDYRLPYEVTLPIPQTGEEADAPQGERNRRLPPVQGQHTVLVSDQEPRRGGQARLLSALPSQFSDEKVLPREEGIAQAPDNLTFFAAPTPIGTFSTGLGSDVHSHARQVTITRKANDEPPEMAPPPARDDLAALRRVADLLREAGFQTEEVPVPLPPEHAEHLVVHVFQPPFHAYLAERARRPGEYGPLLVAARLGLAPATTDDLRPLLTTRQGRRSWPAALPGWQLLTVPHAFTDDQRFAAGVQGRLERLRGQEQQGGIQPVKPSSP